MAPASIAFVRRWGEVGRAPRCSHVAEGRSPLRPRERGEAPAAPAVRRLLVPPPDAAEQPVHVRRLVQSSSLLPLHGRRGPREALGARTVEQDLRGEGRGVSD
jgi:hypothetical protein